ncbi:peptide-methionine (S)-S-oxide reductase MsrA, partial [Verrucomicrobia bacterium]|nr:peptide-methionine (S)-S-oxide reductase MsrA [Verrucomicrobiota bacterium]
MIMNSETQTLAQSKPAPSPQVVERSQKATFGGGCFWCTEAMLEDVEGILSVVSGYAGGHVKNPTYRHVCEGTTGHAEVVQVIFDPVKITYKRVLELFWRSHDPTSLNRQGADVGT